MGGVYPSRQSCAFSKQDLASSNVFNKLSFYQLGPRWWPTDIGYLIKLISIQNIRYIEGTE